jgi:hypothetical protein
LTYGPERKPKYLEEFIQQCDFISLLSVFQNMEGRLKIIWALIKAMTITV